MTLLKTLQELHQRSYMFDDNEIQLQIHTGTGTYKCQSVEAAVAVSKKYKLTERRFSRKMIN